MGKRRGVGASAAEDVPNMDLIEPDGVKNPLEDVEEPADSSPGDEEAEEGDEKKNAEEEGEEAPPAAYVPNLKYKVYDEEKEFHKSLQGVIKSKEDEEYFRDLYTKADGLDKVKERQQYFADLVENHYRPLEEKHNSLAGFVQQMGGLVQNKDFRALFKNLRLSDEDILRYAQTVIEEAELPPQQREFLQRQRQTEEQNEYLAQQGQTYEKQLQKQMADLRSIQLQTEISRPEVSEIAKEYDARFGKNAFQKECINRGILNWVQKNQDSSPAEVVADLVKLYGPLLRPGPAPKTPTAPSTPRAKRDLPVIPNIEGKSAAPTKVKVKSLDDLRQIAAQMR